MLRAPTEMMMDQPPHPEAPETGLQEMIRLIARLAPTDGVHRTVIPALSFYRCSSLSEAECVITQASLVVAVQGQKRIVLAGRAYDYGPMHGLITAMDLPVMARVISASAEEPYLCLVYDLDMNHMTALMGEIGLTAPKGVPEGQALSVCPVSAALFDAALRLTRILDTPADIPFVAPLIERELLYRLLTGEQGTRLRHLTRADSQTYKIARAIDYLKRRYMDPLRISALAQHVNMSVSSLHHHFKAVTSMSPLQYQKQLRLHEARRLLIRQTSDIATVAYGVGYESPSQFTRDYRRLFGAPPTRDIGMMREKTQERP